MATSEMNGIPGLGFGTGPLGLGVGQEQIAAALQAGFRHIDTAQGYRTEPAVGAAIRESGLADVFVTTKVADTKLAREDFRPSVEASREALGVEAIDLLLIHWPSKDAVPMATYMEELARVRQDGLARMVGVSNFPIALVDQAIDVVGEGVIASNQVELHPFLQQPRLVEHCKSRGVVVTAYLPLARGRVSDDPVLRRIAEAHGVTPSQVTLAWLRQTGIVAIPSSKSPGHMAENIASEEVTLTDADLAEIAGLDRGERIIDPEKAPAWDR